MLEQPAIHTGGIGEAIAMGEYLRQCYPHDAIVSAVGEVVDDQGVRAYLPTFVEEASRIYRDHPDQRRSPMPTSAGALAISTPQRAISCRVNSPPVTWHGWR
jgi:hypothetical protein